MRAYCEGDTPFIMLVSPPQKGAALDSAPPEGTTATRNKNPLGTLIAILGQFFLDQLCYIGGATPTILPYARTYISILLVGAPFIASGFLMNMQLRFQGESFYSMLCMVAGAVLNTILTPLFIFPLGLGIAGSALATTVSEAVSFFLLLYEMRTLETSGI